MFVGNNMRSFVIFGDCVGEGLGFIKFYLCKVGFFEKYIESLVGYVSLLNVLVVFDLIVLENME